jgi:hypothetical protein
MRRISGPDETRPRAAAKGLPLILSPWLFGITAVIAKPQVAIGPTEFLVAATGRRYPPPRAPRAAAASLAHRPLR